MKVGSIRYAMFFVFLACVTVVGCKSSGGGRGVGSPGVYWDGQPQGTSPMAMGYLNACEGVFRPRHVAAVGAPTPDYSTRIQLVSGTWKTHPDYPKMPARWRAVINGYLCSGYGEYSDRDHRAVISLAVDPATGEANPGVLEHETMHPLVFWLCQRCQWTVDIGDRDEAHPRWLIAPDGRRVDLRAAMSGHGGW